ncbi:phage tail protein [Roseixanthobacter glucoisosaccharinicivorans]|uniref:phage tail protein n=1 Tax=Roseixanthobacter glucoisosaccharinicivorans TaxID=3119923 RepID=UPI00372AEC6C
MSDYYLGEIRIFPYGRVPAGWAKCDGTLMQVQQYQALFTLLGNRFGGDGRTTFALPDLRGRVPVNFNVQAQADRITIQLNKPLGTETVTLTQAELPTHTHLYCVSTQQGNVNAPNDAVFAEVTQVDASKPQANYYGAASQMTAVKADAIRTEGTGGPHSNIQPSIALNLCIALVGNYPPRP